jgi:sec-independent protein translocase protein TatA
MIGLGAQELIIILIIIIVLFGATRLPQLGKGIGLAIRNFKRSTTELEGAEKSPASDGEDEGKKDKSS